MNVILFLCFLFVLFNNVRRGILIYAPFKLFFISGYSLFGQYDFDLVFSIIAVLAYFLCYDYKKEIKRIPWLFGIVVALICYILNSLYPLFHPLIALQNTFEVYLYAMVYFASIKNRMDLRLAVFAICIFIILLVGNGLIEFLTGYNPLGDFQRLFVKQGVFISEQDMIRFGIHRTRSFVPHSIGFGVECVCFFIFLLYFYQYERTWLSGYSVIVLLGLCAVGVILSGSRSPLLGLVVMILPFIFDKRYLSLKTIAACCVIALLVNIFAVGYIENMFSSLFEERSLEQASGSSIDMRQMQLEYSVAVWLQKPIWGWGASADIFEFGERNEILGAESVWFTLMMKRGIVGMASYVFLYIAIIYSVRKAKSFWFITAFMLGWLTIDTSTNLPGINFFFPLMIITLMLKIEGLGGFSKK